MERDKTAYSKFARLRLAELCEEDSLKDDEIPNDGVYSFKDEYKQKYSDIKISVKEDW